MVSLDEVRASNAQLTLATTPRVVVFVGGTAGIGKATLTKLVSTGFPIKAYIVGRNAAEHEPFTKEIRASNKDAEIIFLEGQVSLLADTKRLTDEIKSREKRLDLLFLSAGFLPFTGRQETSEGLELAFAVAYYSRQLFIRRLLPLLNAAAAANASTGSYDPPRVINVLGTGGETTNINLDDPTLAAPGAFSIPAYIAHVGTFTSASLKRLAEDPANRGVLFAHHHPGFVSTDLIKKSWGGSPPGGGGAAPPAPADLVKATPEESGERSLFVATSAKYGGKGVPVPAGQEPGTTVKGTAGGSLWSISDRLETLRLGVLDELEKSGAADAIEKNVQEVLGAYL